MFPSKRKQLLDKLSLVANCVVDASDDDTGLPEVIDKLGSAVISLSEVCAELIDRIDSLETQSE